PRPRARPGRAGKFTPVHDAWWAAAVKAHRDTAGTRALIEVLLLGRHVSRTPRCRLGHRPAGGSPASDAVALEARKVAQAEDEPAGHASPAGAATVTFLHEWRLAHLPPDIRPLPSVTHYDQLLRRRRASGGEHREGEAQ
ncbi:IS21 family transposase, partial [Streptomyces sp. NPDC057456]